MLLEAGNVGFWHQVLAFYAALSAIILGRCKQFNKLQAAYLIRAHVVKHAI